MYARVLVILMLPPFLAYPRCANSQDSSSEVSTLVYDVSDAIEICAGLSQDSKSTATSPQQYLLQLIRTHVDPPSWQQETVHAEMSSLGNKDQLRVTQTAANHEAIQDLLSALRRHYTFDVQVQMRLGLITMSAAELRVARQLSHANPESKRAHDFAAQTIADSELASFHFDYWQYCREDWIIEKAPIILRDTQIKGVNGMPWIKTGSAHTVQQTLDVPVDSRKVTIFLTPIVSADRTIVCNRLSCRNDEMHTPLFGKKCTFFHVPDGNAVLLLCNHRPSGSDRQVILVVHQRVLLNEPPEPRVIGRIAGGLFIPSIVNGTSRFTSAEPVPRP